eukprot:6206163-Pleurochrysis_carterae.AAC.1
MRDESCHAPLTESVVREACVGRSSCTLHASVATFKWHESACGEEPSSPLRLWAALRCSALLPTIHANVSIPVGSQAYVRFPLRELSRHFSLSESSIEIASGREMAWEQEVAISAHCGVKSVLMEMSKASEPQIVARVGSGEYNFELKPLDAL